MKEKTPMTAEGARLLLSIFLAWVVLPVAAQSQKAPASPPPRIISRGVAAGTYQAFPDVCRLKNGDLLCVFYAGYDHISFPNESFRRGGRIAMIRSKDDGHSWSEPEVLYDSPEDDRDPHISQMGNGTVICSFFVYRQPKGGRPEADTCIIESKDGGKTWPAQHRLLVRNWPCSAPVRELPDGSWILGAYHEDADTAYGGMLRSVDQGLNWSDPTPIGKGEGVRLDAETDFILLRDGTLLAALRGDRVNLHFSISPDLGRTWSRVRDSGFKGHCPHFLRLSSGEILLSHRLPDTSLHVSRDDGKTWGEPLLIDQRIGAYPSTVERRDGSVLVIYYEEGAGSAIRCRRFRLGPKGLEFLPLECREAAIHLGNRRELMIDDHLVEKLSGVGLQLHPPVDAGEVLKFDRPWEGAFSGYATVLRDGETYRLYYRGSPKAGADGNEGETTCYAESPDGIHWTKPNLGLFEVGGGRNNNVVLAGQAPYSHNFSPFIDTRPGVSPTERFKALAGTSEKGLVGFVSADGTRWRKIRDQPLMTQGAFDSQNVAFWSDAEGGYAMYFRTWTEGGFKGFRTISRATSQDFLNWSSPVEMNMGDTPVEHLYTSQTHPYFRAPHIAVSFPMRFVPGRKVLTADQARELGVDPGYSGDSAEAVFMATRGGSRYSRRFLEGYIRPGLDPGNWASRAGLTALGMVQTGPTEMSLYKQSHYAQPSAGLTRYVSRLDGFASIHAPFGGGEWLSKVFDFTGRRLFLNFSTGAAGRILVEIQDAEGNAVPGFGMKDCDELAGDQISREVTWRAGSDLASLANSPVRLRMIMKDADLFSLKFEP